MNKQIIGLLGGFCMGLMVGVCADESDQGLFIPEVLSLGVNALADFKADRPDFTSDNKEFVETVDREIEMLRSRYVD